VIVNAQPTPLDRIATLLYPDLTTFADAVLKSEILPGEPASCGNS